MTTKLILLLSALAFAALGGFLLMRRKSKSVERTFAIIKPDAVAAGHAPAIIQLIKDNGFTIVAERNATVDKEAAEQFYGVHKDKPFYQDLVAYITSGPVVLLTLEKENAVQSWRTLMGATNPEKAQAGTIRKLYGTDIQHNAVHGSDSVENAHKEIAQFFPPTKCCGGH